MYPPSSSPMPAAASYAASKAAQSRMPPRSARRSTTCSCPPTRRLAACCPLTLVDERRLARKAAGGAQRVRVHELAIHHHDPRVTKIADALRGVAVHQDEIGGFAHRPGTPPGVRADPVCGLDCFPRQRFRPWAACPAVELELA